MVDERSLPIANFDGVLSCLHLRWQCTCGHAGLLPSIADHELIPLISFKKYACFMKKDFAVDMLSVRQ